MDIFYKLSRSNSIYAYIDNKNIYNPSLLKMYNVIGSYIDFIHKFKIANCLEKWFDWFNKVPLFHALCILKILIS